MFKITQIGTALVFGEKIEEEYYLKYSPVVEIKPILSQTEDK